MAADLLGRRRTLIFGGALGVVSAATMAFAPSLALLPMLTAIKYSKCLGPSTSVPVSI